MNIVIDYVHQQTLSKDSLLTYISGAQPFFCCGALLTNLKFGGRLTTRYSKTIRNKKSVLIIIICI